MATILAPVMTASLAGCSGSPSPKTIAANASADITAVAGVDTGSKQGGGKLVVYSPNSEDFTNVITPLFEEEHGVDMEVIQAGTGELAKRIQSEKEDPYADVLFGGSWSLMYDNKDLWEPYVFVSDGGAMDVYKSTCGFITGNVLDGNCLIVNTDLIGDIKTNSYAGLLNPGLKGRIATYDPANSSSALAQLINILLAMGGYEDDGAWEFVEDLFTNIGGKTCESSSAVHKGVASGEYMVGLSYEDPCVQLARDGTPVKMVYPTEDAVYLPASATIIKGVENMDNVKPFMDFIVSEGVQNTQGTILTNRPVLKDAKTSDFMTLISEIYIIEEGIPYVSEYKKGFVNRYTDIFVGIESNKQSTNPYGNRGATAILVIKRLGG